MCIYIYTHTRTRDVCSFVGLPRLLRLALLPFALARFSPPPAYGTYPPAVQHVCQAESPTSYPPGAR